MDGWDEKAEDYANALVGLLHGTDKMWDAVVLAYKAGAIAGIERCVEIVRDEAKK